MLNIAFISSRLTERFDEDEGHALPVNISLYQPQWDNKKYQGVRCEVSQVVLTCIGGIFNDDVKPQVTNSLPPSKIACRQAILKLESHGVIKLGASQHSVNLNDTFGYKCDRWFHATDAVYTFVTLSIVELFHDFVQAPNKFIVPSLGNIRIETLEDYSDIDNFTAILHDPFDFDDFHQCHVQKTTDTLCIGIDRKNLTLEIDCQELQMTFHIDSKSPRKQCSNTRSTLYFVQEHLFITLNSKTLFDLTFPSIKNSTSSTNLPTEISEAIALLDSHWEFIFTEHKKQLAQNIKNQIIKNCLNFNMKLVQVAAQGNVNIGALFEKIQGISYVIGKNIYFYECFSVLDSDILGTQDCGNISIMKIRYHGQVKIVYIENERHFRFYAFSKLTKLNDPKNVTAHCLLSAHNELLQQSGRQNISESEPNDWKPFLEDLKRISNISIHATLQFDDHSSFENHKLT